MVLRYIYIHSLNVWLEKLPEVHVLIMERQSSYIPYLQMYVNVISHEYDKLDAFPFNIVNFPNLSGIMPKKTLYGVFIAQVHRYASACMEYIDFIVCLRNLIGKFNRFYNRKVLIKTFRKFCKKYKDKL